MHSLNIRDDLPQGENKKFEWEILSLAELSELCFLRHIYRQNEKSDFRTKG